MSEVNLRAVRIDGAFTEGLVRICRPPATLGIRDRGGGGTTPVRSISRLC